MTANSFGSRATLQVAGHRLRRSTGWTRSRTSRPAVQPEDPAREPAAHRGRRTTSPPSTSPRSRSGTRRPSRTPRSSSRPARVILQDLTGVPAVVDLATHARGHAAARRRPGQDQPAGPGRARHRPLGGRRRVRPPGRVRPQRGPGVPAQPGAVRVPALGAGGVQPVQGGAAGHRASCTRSTSSTWPGWSWPSDGAGLPRHLRRHRLAHHHAERPRRARLGRRRHRGRGGDARPADQHADPAGRRLPADRRAARRRHRHRPGPHHHRAAAQARRGRQVRRVPRRRAWPRCRWPTGPRSAT